uniref:RdRp n=1 Tax=Phyllosticta capitalensis polymycovirus 1 TaxID=3367395 RepID=A0AB74UJT9_9VIRU
MSTTSSAPPAYLDDARITVSAGEPPKTRSEPLVAHVSEMVNAYARTALKGGLLRGRRTMTFNVQGSALPAAIEVTSFDEGLPPVVSVPAARANAFNLAGKTQAELYSALGRHDQPAPPRGSGRRFNRDSTRLRSAVAKAQRLKDPSFLISRTQLPKSFSFAGRAVSEVRPLAVHALTGARKALTSVPDPKEYYEHAKETVELGDYTTHDPDTLPPRFLEYVHERIRRVDKPTQDAMNAAKRVLSNYWKSRGLAVKARPFDDARPEALREMLNKGSPGEYREYGATDRLDPRLVETMSSSLLRYEPVGRAVAAGKRVPKWVNTTVQPTLSFGKDEPKAAKLVGGARVAPVPRFIFNVSPINYALAVFLHGDISKFLQEKDDTHGPGFGPGRGRSKIFLDFVTKCFGDANTVPDDQRVVMSDISKWGANMCEALLDIVMDLMEDSVDKTGLSPAATAARAAMVTVARRQLKQKLLEHPSGYLVNLFGCMPSGSYYTSLVNTIGNDLLLLGHAIDRAVTEQGFTYDGAADELEGHVQGSLISYGDNQAFSETIMTRLGFTYSPDKHAEFLARFGMTLKVEETEVTTQLARVRFCSRAVVRTPHGLLVTRTHTSMYTKLAGRPEHHPFVDKLYVRALMVDYMGTDPIAYQVLAGVDAAIDASDPAGVLTRAKMDVLRQVARSMYGADDEATLASCLVALQETNISRRALLSLHTPKGSPDVAKLGSSLMAGGLFTAGALTPAAEWSLRQTPQSYGRYLRETGQEGVLRD